MTTHRPKNDKPKAVTSNVVTLHPKPQSTVSGHSTDDVLRHLLATPPVKKPKAR